MTMRLTRRELMTGAVAAAALAACGDGGGDGGGGGVPTGSTPSSGSTATPAIQTARRDTARVGSVNPIGTGSALLAFSTALYGRLVEGSEENLVVSPASVAFALAMTANGAAGATLEELLTALGAGSLGELNTALNEIDQALAQRSGMRQGGFDRAAEVQLRLANSLWGQQDQRFEPAFLDRLAQYYGAGMNLVDYATDVEGARTLINGWVSDQTEAKIPELLEEGVLGDSTRLVLTNAVYLKAPWLEPFDAASTGPAPFRLADGGMVSVDTMHVAARMGAYAAGQGWTAVELPYLGGELAITIVMPDDGTWAAYEAGLSADSLGAVLAALERRAISLSLSKWTSRRSLTLNETLGALGVRQAFSQSEADLSGMTGDRTLFVSAVVHEAYILVEESGTEAAAATGAVVNVVSAPADPPPVVEINRPFLFAVRDVPTGAVLFMGRVLDPRPA